MKTQLPVLRPSLKQAALFAAIVTLSAIEGYSAEAQYVVRPRPGGMSPTPDITSMVSSNSEVTVKWNGFAGPYQLEKLPQIGGQWEAVGGATTGKEIKIPGGEHHAIFRVKGAAPSYAGADLCAECHDTTAHHWSQTPHATALDTLKAIGMGANAACVTCHTVGAGIQGGFSATSATATTLAGVQCESCHGPAAAHANDPDNLLVRPVITASANLCGGCHDGEHHPTFGEWQTTLHSRVDEHVAGYFEDPASGAARMQSCGACHSGATRLAMLRTTQGAPLELPSGEEAANTGITCATCHSPHQSGTNVASLRNPLTSTNFFTYNTATSTSFAAQYDANVQVCGQCHNSRNAVAADTSRPPHHSPQYNILIGNIGPDGPGIVTSRHSTLEKQCVTCHMHSMTPEVVSVENPAVTGHEFAPKGEACVSCHKTVENAEAKVANLQNEIHTRIGEVKTLLETWCETKAPEALRTKYGKLSWEYTTPGQISNPSGAAAAGPNSTDQKLIPTEIKQVRMWVYLIEHDGSYGVHNPKFARYVLAQAKTNLETLLSAP